jgi:enoyl-CoA hydratase/carnithine racemase
LPELLVGVPFPTAAWEVVRIIVPRERLQSLIYTGRTLSDREALDARFVDEVVSPDTLPAPAQEFARQLLRIPPPEYRLTKKRLRVLGRTTVEPSLHTHRDERRNRPGQSQQHCDCASPGSFFFSLLCRACSPRW